VEPELTLDTPSPALPSLSTPGCGCRGGGEGGSCCWVLPGKKKKTTVAQLDQIKLEQMRVLKIAFPSLISG